jgi:hypothetical protein
MSEEALIQVARTSTRGDVDEVQVELVKGKTHIRVALTMEQFGNLMTGSAHVPCKVVRWHMEDKN